MSEWFIPILMFIATFFGAYLGGMVVRRTFSKEWERVAARSRKRTQDELAALFKQLEEDRDGRADESRSDTAAD